MLLLDQSLDKGRVSSEAHVFHQFYLYASFYKGKRREVFGLGLYIQCADNCRLSTVLLNQVHRLGLWPLSNSSHLNFSKKQKKESTLG